MSELLDRLAQSRQPAGEKQERDPKALAPLSYAQERMWFLEQLWPMTAAYSVPMPYRLVGKLDPQALRAALNNLIARHEVLRTVFVEADGQASQRIWPVFELPLAVEDLAAMTPASRDTALRECLDEAAQRGFDLAQAPPFAARLLRLGPQEHALVFVIHHMIFDEWSEEVLLADLAELYQAELSGRPAQLPELAYQYADYAIEQREWMAGPQCQAQLDYWCARLAGLPEVLDLPIDRPRAAFASADGAWVPSVVPHRVSEAVRALCAAQGVTPFVVLLASCQVLLARLSGQTDIVVGTPISNRSTIQTERLIGLLLNSLAIRADLSGSPTFRALVTQARETMLDAFANRDLPFDRLVQEVSPQRSLGLSPIFQVMFTYHTAAEGVVQWADGLRVETLEFETQVAKFDLALDIIDYSDHMVATAGYRTEVFDEATVRDILAHWQALLAALLSDPDAPVDLTPSPRKHLAEQEPASAPRVAIAAGTALPERGELQRVLREVFEEVLGIEPVGVSESFFALGGHSLSAVRLCGQLRRRLHIKIPVEAVFQAPSVLALAAAICGEAQLGGALEPFIALNPDPAHPPVFYVPPVTGIAWCYAGLSGLAPGLGGYGLQSPGLLPGSAQSRSLPQLARDYVARIRTVAPDGPFRLVGWSIGGIVAHEMAVQLAEDGQRVQLLALVDAYPLADLALPPDTAHTWHDLLVMLGVPAADIPDEVTGPRAALDVLHRRPGLLSELDIADLGRLYDVAANNLRLALEFRPRRFPGGAVHLTATVGGFVTPAQIWQPYLGEALTSVPIRASHLEMFTPEAVQQIAGVLSSMHS